MIKFKLKLWATLSILGIIGVASLSFSDLVSQLPPKIAGAFPPEQIKWMLLINPAILALLWELFFMIK